AEGEPVDRCDRRLRDRLEQLPDVLTELAPLPSLADLEPAHVLDVGARDERPVAGAGQDDGARALVVPQLQEPIAELGQRRQVERVHRVGTVDGEDRDSVLACELDRYARTFFFRNSTI